MIKSENHIFGGMQRDISISKHKPEFLYDALNIRFTAKEGDTLLSITNEKGPSIINTIPGNYVGHWVFKEYIIAFSKGEVGDYITIIFLQYFPEIATSGYGSVYTPYVGPLNLGPIVETLGVTESEDIHKVYWVDGINRPRYLIVEKLLGQLLEEPVLIPSDFDFSPRLKLEEVISVEKKVGEGLFAPGTIQYAFSYYNKYGAESCLFYATTLKYIAFSERGGSPEESVPNSFIIKIQNWDDNFEYLRVYSIHRTTQDAIPTCKRVIDIDLLARTGDSEILVVDNGQMGETIDNTELLYKGASDIIAGTLCQKDNTLFLGNIKYYSKDAASIEGVVDTINEDTGVVSYLEESRFRGGDTNSFYIYDNTLNRVLDDLNPIALETPGFKSGEHYRLGIQFQHESGRWSTPIPVGVNVSNIYLHSYTVPTSIRPSLTYSNNEGTRKKVCIKITPDLSDIKDSLKAEGYVRMRPLCVFPSPTDRLILTQGVLCPTVFNVKDRLTSSPFAQSSWFFRPILPIDTNTLQNTTWRDASLFGEWREFRHDYLLPSPRNRNAELQGDTGYDNNKVQANDLTYTSIQLNPSNTAFGIDQSILTMHSPEIESDYFISIPEDSSVQLRIIGIAPILSNISALSIETETSAIGLGLDKINIANTIKDNNSGFRVSGLFWEDKTINVDNNGNYIQNNGTDRFMIYPWQSSGSLNNDEVRPADKGIRTSVLKEKKLSNLFYTGDNIWLDTSLNYSIENIKVFNSNQVELTNLGINPIDSLVPYSYYGNINTVYGTENVKYYGSSAGGSIHGPVNGLGGANGFKVKASSFNIRVKYLSSKHIVLDFKNINNSKPVLPRIGNFNKLKNNTFSPYWSYINTSSIVDGRTVITVEGAYNSIEDAKAGKPNDSVQSYYVIDNSTPASLILKLLRCMFDKNPTHETYRSWIWEWDILPSASSFLASWNNQLYTVAEDGKLTVYTPEEIPTPSSFTLYQDNIDGISINKPFLYIAELYREGDYRTDFGGEETFSNLWIPAGEPVSIDEDELKLTEGDTWYQRYDCLKTYPFTLEDENSVVEIGSFLLETRINIDGRYDHNRAQQDNLVMTPNIFNLINPAYTQRNNYFNYRTLDSDVNNRQVFNSSIAWSKTKTFAEPIDTWTNFNLGASALDLDRAKGDVNALRVYNDKIYSFQDSAIAQILFNSRVQINTSDGIPIEIANSNKVDGKVYITDTVGCHNKKSIAITPSGIYFIDDANSKDLYNLGNGLNNVSLTHGFSNWFKSKDHTNERSFYDYNNNDLYLIWDDTSLLFNEQLGQFTSFMSYGGTTAIFNYDTELYSFRDSGADCNLYKMFDGNYNWFFGRPQPFYITFISNENSSLDKIFTNIETRLDFKNSSTDDILHNKCFDYIRVTNEYQDTGETPINVTPKNSPIKHFDSVGKKKFRIWRLDIPRAMKDGKRSLDRIRNTWTKITLGMIPPTTDKLTLEEITNAISAGTLSPSTNIDRYYEGLDNIEIAHGQHSRPSPASDIGDWKNLKFILHDLSVQYHI